MQSAKEVRMRTTVLLHILVLEIRFLYTAGVFHTLCVQTINFTRPVLMSLKRVSVHLFQNISELVISVIYFSYN